LKENKEKKSKNFCEISVEDFIVGCESIFDISFENIALTIFNMYFFINNIDTILIMMGTSMKTM